MAGAYARRTCRRHQLCGCRTCSRQRKLHPYHLCDQAGGHPEMILSGYRPSLVAGSVAMTGTFGQVIPPSVMLVIYAGVAEVPIGPQLMAGIVPGTILA